MDPYFGYGDNNYSGADQTNDPSNYTTWASQWAQPASAASQGNNFQSYPQYQSQHLQQQQQQAQQQAQNAYAALNPISTFMQQQQKQPFQQQQQKKFGGQQQGGSFPKPNNPRSFGAFGAVSNTSAGIGPEWVQPMSQQSMMTGGGSGGVNPALRTFPSKNGGGNGGGGFPKQPQWRQKPAKQQPPVPKKFETAGKTPAMILHELYKQLGEDYTEVQDVIPKRYRCTLTVEGRQFQMESANKKAAKQKCAELVVRELRPDLHVTPFEEGVNAKATPVKKSNPDAANGQKRNSIQAAEMMNQPAQSKKTAKKAKVAPVESAASLLDFMQKLMLDSETKYNPVFEAVELPQEEAAVTPEVKQEEPVAVPEETVKQEPMEEDVKPSVTEKEKKPITKKERALNKIKKPELQHKVTLKFEELGKEYTKTGPNRGTLKDFVIREALREIFEVSHEDILTVARRHAAGRLGSDMNILQCLNTIASVLNCKVTVEAEPAEDSPMGVGQQNFQAKCIVVDNNENGRLHEIKSHSLPSKTLAKEWAAQEMLKSYFQIDPTTCIKPGEGTNTQGPCAILHTMLNKQTKARETVVYEFKDNVPPVAGNPATVFYCDCIVQGERHTGSGRSKKIAKNEAAMLALKKIFKIDYDPNTVYPMALSSRAMMESKVSPMCRTIAEFCKREYHNMMQTFSNVQASNQISCFVLVNEKDEKRLLSVAGSIQYVVEPDTLQGANGTVLLHCDPIVLARRALLRVFIAELIALEHAPENSIFERKDDGKAALKSNLRLMLYSSFSPVCNLSVDDAPKKRLAIVRPTSFVPVPEDVPTLQEIQEKKDLRIHCAADKLFKWNNIGVQGALLSNVMEPVFISDVYFGSAAPVPDESLKFALVNRLGADETERDVNLESIPTSMRPHMGTSQVWIRGIHNMETLDVNTGRTTKGPPSNICKAQIFEEYRKLSGVDLMIVDYAKAKENASSYQYEKKVLYGKIETAGLGRWQTKPAELVDSFTLAAFD